jgi:hypothetical protein
MPYTLTDEQKELLEKILSFSCKCYRFPAGRVVKCNNCEAREILQSLPLQDQPSAGEVVLKEYQPGKWYHAHTVDEMSAFYLSRLPAIRDAAKNLGYAIAVHGSTRRDFDLIAMPWREEYANKDNLAEAIQKAACGFHHTEYQWEQKPAGRFATSFPICWTEFPKMISGGHIDLSVITAAANFIKLKN